MSRKAPPAGSGRPSRSAYRRSARAGGVKHPTVSSGLLYQLAAIEKSGPKPALKTHDHNPACALGSTSSPNSAWSVRHESNGRTENDPALGSRPHLVRFSPRHPAKHILETFRKPMARLSAATAPTKTSSIDASFAFGADRRCRPRCSAYPSDRASSRIHRIEGATSKSGARVCNRSVVTAKDNAPQLYNAITLTNDINARVVSCAQRLVAGITRGINGALERLPVRT
jgi:hypothetical protein